MEFGAKFAVQKYTNIGDNQVVTSDNGTLEVKIIEYQLILELYENGKEKDVIESFSLFGASEWLRAVRKAENLAFVITKPRESKKFRLKFPSSETCAEFADVLSQFWLPTAKESAAKRSERPSGLFTQRAGSQGLGLDEVFFVFYLYTAFLAF